MAFQIVKNIGLGDPATSTSTGSVCEPTAASNQRQLMVTGNWFASTSTDGGANWSFVDPFTKLPAAAGGFCCDQIVQFNPRFRIWIWLLQYSTPAAGGNNVFRLAISREGTFGSWYWWDFAPANLNAAWTNMWFDYPDMAWTDANLFVTFNGFVGSAWQRAFVFRFPLAALAGGTALGYRWWSTTNNGSIKLCRGAGQVMYMGSHNSLSQVRVFNWPDTASGIGWNDVNVQSWKQGTYSAPGPGGVEWLGRLDGRITGGWVTNGVIGFMWSANRDTNHPLPFIRVACIGEATKSVTSQPDIWSNGSAWAYPAVAPNGNRQVGFSAFYGGGTKHPTHVIGVKTATGWSTIATKASTNGPVGGAWGDYLACLGHTSEPANWIASGYTLQGGSDRKNIEPRYVEFCN
jgi:hypothetical protein